MDLQECIFSVINLIYRGCIRCITMKGFAYKHECALPTKLESIPSESMQSQAPRLNDLDKLTMIP